MIWAWAQPARNKMAKVIPVRCKLFKLIVIVFNVSIPLDEGRCGVRTQLDYVFKRRRLIADRLKNGARTVPK
jgi:hypothetical protein